MTAPRTLPRCPVCGNRRIPLQYHMDGFKRLCQSTTHDLTVYGRTVREADARWRRLAGARGEKP